MTMQVVRTGKGVECLLLEGSHSAQRSRVRFGSLDYIQESLPASQSAALDALGGGLRDTSVVSVLVKSPAEEQRSSSSETSLLMRYMPCSSHVQWKAGLCILEPEKQVRPGEDA